MNVRLIDYVRGELVNPHALAGLRVYLAFLFANVLTGLAFLLFRNPGSPSSWGLVPADDTWNALVYARSFADTLTFAYNTGIPEAGMTSPLWVVLLGMTSWLLSPLSLSLPAVAQITGLALGTVVSAFVYLIVKRITGMQKAGVLAGILIALDPTFAFARVAGSEAILFSALSLGMAWALLQGRLTVASILIALAVVTRPEGFLLVGVAAFAMISKWLWEFGKPDTSAFDDLQELILLVTPGILAGIAWAAYNVSVSGTPFPNTFYINQQYTVLYDPQKISAIWNGYLSNISYLNGLHMLVTASVMLFGAYYALRRGGFMAVTLILTPLILLYAFSIFLPMPSTEWNFSTRRYLDPILPFLVILIALGIAYAWQASERYVQSQERLDDEWRSQLRGTLVVCVTIVAVVPLLGLPFRWAKLVPEYSWNARNIAEVSIPIAGWIDDNLPRDARIATLSPGALGYFSERQLTDLTGLNNQDAIGKSLFDSVSGLDVDYIVAYDNLYIKSWPQTAEIASIRTENNTVLDGSRLVVFQNQEEPSLAEKDSVRNISLKKLELIDSLDVGDSAQEADHDWEMNPQTLTLTRTFRTNAEAIIEDDASITTGYESFRVNTVAGKDLIIVKRYDAAVRGAVRVFINGQQVGIWRFPPRDYFFGEDQFIIPASFITGSTAVLKLEHIPDPEGLTSLNSFYYWIFVQKEEG